MKTKYLYITAIFLLGLSAPAQAQSEPGAFDGIQSSVNQWVDAAAETYESLKQKYDELIRIGMLMGSDIRMMMNAKFKEKGFGTYILGILESKREGSLYAEFDRQNMAESMRVKSSGSHSKWIAGGYQGKSEQPKEDFTMYIDKPGYWYVPIELEGVQNYSGYLRVNPMGGMQDVAKMLEVSIEAAIDAKVAEMLKQLAILALLDLDPGNEWIMDFIPPEFMKAGIEEQLKPLLEELAKLQFEQVSGFPAFIHFAFIFSPTLARTQFNVQEQTVTWKGQDNCTKMTVVSGKDEGYQVVFDGYGRLIHLRDTNGDTADYWYDKDVTVTIPPAISMDMGKLMQLNKN